MECMLLAWDFVWQGEDTISIINIIQATVLSLYKVLCNELIS